MPNKGFTLIETTIAVFILTIGALGAFALINQTISFAPQASYQLTASYLAQEGLELVRNIRDQNWLEWRQAPGLVWNDGLIGCVAGCEIDYLADSLNPYTGAFLKSNMPLFGNMIFGYQYSSGVASKYQRKITITSPIPGKMLVASEVFWQEKERSHSVIAETELYDWRKLND